MPRWGQSSFQVASVPSAATVDLSGVENPRVLITGTTNIGAFIMRANQLLFVTFDDALTITHNATTLFLPNNGQNLPVRAKDWCILATGSVAANVEMLTFESRTTRSRLTMAAGGIIDFVNGNIAESGDALNFNGFSAGYAFNNGPIITQQAAYSQRLINDSSSASAEVSRQEGLKSGSAVNGDEAYVSRWLKNGSGTQAEIARWGWRITDITNGSEDALSFLSMPVNGSMAKRFEWTPTAFTPATASAASLGTSSLPWLNGTLTGTFAVGASATSIVTMNTTSAGNITARLDTTTIPALMTIDNAGITSGALDHGAQLNVRFGTGGSIASTAAAWQIVASEDWSVAANRSAVVRFNVRINDAIGCELQLGTAALGGGVVARPDQAIPAAGSLDVGFKATSTANFGVFFGSGAPTLAAAKGSLYLRSDGSATNNRAYIATDSAGNWTPLTTGA